MNQTYKNFLLDLDNDTQKVHYVRIQINNIYDGWYDGQYIEGRIINGSVSVNGSSAVRRTGNLTMVADPTIVNITLANNIISINKEIKIEVGLENHIDINYPEIIWFKLGTYVITQASVTQNINSLNISITLKDLMAKLNGECGGTIPVGVIHSPVIEYNADRTEKTKTPVLYQALVKELLLEYTDIPEENMYIDVKGKNNSIVADANGDYWLKNTVRWINTQPIYGYYGATIPSTEVKLYHLTLTKPTDRAEDEIDTYSFNDSIGYQLTPFTFPSQNELSSNAGEPITSVLDKIKNSLGNFEYFFDIDGKFHFQEINNGINQGSIEIDLSAALSDWYLPQLDDAAPIYEFENSPLPISYSNNPQFNAIKNDIVVWGVRGDGKLPLRYRLVIDHKPTIPNSITYQVYYYTDAAGVLRVRKERKATTDISTTITLSSDSDWRWYLYLEYVINDRLTPYSKELEEEFPKIFNVVSGGFYAAGANGSKNIKTLLNSMTYFLDIIDPDELDEGVKDIFENICVSKIGRRPHVITNNDVNTLFTPQFPNIVYIESGAEDTAARRKQAIDNGWSFAQVPSYIAENLAIGRATNSAFDMVRSILHETSTYNENISLTSIPIYYLDVNKKIAVKNDDVVIDNDYIISHISIPLAANGNMSISAKRAIQRI